MTANHRSDGFLVHRLDDSLFGDDAGDEAGGGDVEGGVIDADAFGGGLPTKSDTPGIRSDSFYFSGGRVYYCHYPRYNAKSYGCDQVSRKCPFCSLEFSEHENDQN